MLSLKKWYLLGFAILLGALGAYSLYLPQAEEAVADFDNEPQIVQQTTLLALAPLPQVKVAKKVKVIATAYSSTVHETDEDPFTTASGTQVRDGIVANNLLAFGTGIRLPEIFGDKVFVVEDRMHPRKGYYHVDVWFPSYELALAFGSKLTEMEILTN